MRIVLDPGHGGKDPGAIGRVLGIKEKDITLGIAKILSEKLQESGHKVFLTRSGDEYVSLANRAAKFEQWKGDFVLSIHINSSETTTASYVSSWLSNTDNRELTEMANKLSHACSMALNWPDGGVRTANLYVLRHSSKPTCLVELGFISNPEQEKALAKASVREKIASVLHDVINGPAQDKDTVDVFFDGKIITKGELINNTTYVPVREFAQTLGLYVSYDEKNARVLITEANQEQKVLNENEVEILFIKTPAVIGEFKNSTTLAPVKELAEMLGYRTLWDANTKTVSIIKAP